MQPKPNPADFTHNGELQQPHYDNSVRAWEKLERMGQDEKHEDVKYNSCPEFPFFGAWYPDATCIDGFLWDMDKCDENGMLYNGGDEPCPFCNTKTFIEQNEDEENTKESLTIYIEKLREKYS